MTGTDGLWEIRVKAGNGIYRVFCFFDKGNVVLLLNGFQKKDPKNTKKRTETREKFEEEFETFRIGVLIQEARKRQKLAQQQLADQVGTTKNYISRIKNNASDIRLSTLMRIIREGLGGSLKLSLDI